MKSLFQESKTPRAYWIWTGVILLFGAALRFLSLGDAAMTELEAANANAALSLIRADFSAQSNEPLYIFLTSVVFKLFTDQLFTARLIPALFGCALMFIPFLFRNRFSSGTILIWTLFLALDPALIAWSKRADGAIIAVCLLAFLIGALINRSIPAVVILSAALIASPLRSLPVTLAAIVIAASFGLISSLFFDGNFRPIQRIREIFGGRIILISCGLALVFATAFFANPSGVGALGNGIAKAFFEPSLFIPPFAWLVLVWGYYGFQWILTIGCRINGQRTRSDLKILLPAAALMMTLLAVFFNQGVLAFVWTAPILTLCSALAVDSILDRLTPPFKFIEKIYFFVPTAFLVAGALTLSAFHRYANISTSLSTPVRIGELNLPITQAQQFFLLALIILTVIYFLIPMVVTHFSYVNLNRSGAAGILAAALLIIIGNAWDAAGFYHQGDAPTRAVAALTQPLLGDQSYVEAAVLLPEISAIGEKTHLSSNEAAGMIVQQDDDAALRWTLRDYPNAIFSPFPIRETAAQLDFYLTEDQPAELISAYSGMEVVTSRSIRFESMNDLSWIRWLLNREIPIRETRRILWQKNAILYSK